MDDSTGRLWDALSAARMMPYAKSCGGDAWSAFRLHCWNTELSEAFYGPLQFLEVGMRNALHRELRTIFGREDWWDSQRIRLHHEAAANVSVARDKLVKARRDPTPDRMVAELPFGFWVSLVGRGDQYEMRLWRPGLRRAFPTYRGPRQALHKDLYQLRLFRTPRPCRGRRLAAARYLAKQVERDRPELVGVFAPDLDGILPEVAFSLLSSRSCAKRAVQRRPPSGSSAMRTVSVRGCARR